MKELDENQNMMVIIVRNADFALQAKKEPHSKGLMCKDQF
jgi:hypothetical protein